MEARGLRGAAAALALTLIAASGCSTVPYTNRSQFMVMSESDDLRLGAAAYQQVLKEEKISHDPRFTEPVQEVGRRIAAAADKPEYQWEFAVIDDPKQANAFCLPGGKVAVYTGIFPIAKDEAGLATVIGHEVAHALARHGAERVSTGMALQAAGAAVAIAAGGQSAGTQQAIMSAYGSARRSASCCCSAVRRSPRRIARLILMAKAWYNPDVRLCSAWRRLRRQGPAGVALDPSGRSDAPRCHPRVDRRGAAVPNRRRRNAAAAGERRARQQRRRHPHCWANEPALRPH
jgi:hypothetical protein